MAFCDGREDDGRGWQDDDWKDLVTDKQEQEDALFKCLDEDELEDVQESIVDELFVMQLVDVPLDLVERLSWDAACQGPDEEDEEAAKPTLPTLRPLEVGIALDDNNLECGLISPCSETSSPRTMMSPLMQTVSNSSSVCLQNLPEPEHEIRSNIEPITEEGEQEEEEVTIHDSEWSPDVNSVLSSPVARISANPFATYQPSESAEMDYWPRDNAISDNESNDVNQLSPVVSALRPSLLPRVSSIAQWRRLKARSCSGAGSAGTLIALKSATLKASLSRSRSRSIGDEDDGDFSSDDEGFTPGRTSETERPNSSQWRRARQKSINFPSHRLSVNMSMRPTMMTKRLQEAKDKLNSGLHLLRSGSTVSTVMSEENYLESPVCQEIKSAPPELYCESSIFATATSLVSAASACTIDSSNTHHPTRQQQLRAGVFKAAGLLNAASAEAARKLKSRSFRAPSLSTQKAASETEEEDPTASDHCGAIEIYEA